MEEKVDKIKNGFDKHLLFGRVRILYILFSIAGNVGFAHFKQISKGKIQVFIPWNDIN